MKAFAIERYGNDALQAMELPRPALRDEHDVVVQVHAASLNPVDFKIRDGKLKAVLRLRLPVALGNDFSGVVVEAGAAVRDFHVGDAVHARADKDRIGSFAEFIAIRASSVAPMPRRTSMEEAASLPLVALTAWQAFVERGALARGQKVLIHAGSGGVGTIAIQIAKHLGAFVATTTSTANVEWVKALGADRVIDYKKQDYAAELRDYDLVLDTLGGDTTLESLRVLRPGGRLVSISGPPDPAFAREWRLGWVMEQVFRVLSHRVRRRASQMGVSYSFLFMHPDGAQLREIGALVDAGVLRPVIDRVFPFAQTLDAMAYIETGRAKGKVVIKLI